MAKTEWVKERSRYILIRGNFKATINKKRRYGVVQFWTAISEWYNGEWVFLRNLPPCGTLAEMKAAVEDHNLFVTPARRKELAAQRKQAASARMVRYKTRREIDGEEWWHR